MRTFLLLCLAAVLIVLILLVDWREKFSPANRRELIDRVGQFWPPAAPADSAAPPPDTLANELPPIALDPPLEFAGPAAPDSAGPAGRVRTPFSAAPKSPGPPPYQDITDEQYRRESRRILQKATSYYDLIRRDQRRKKQQNGAN